jgi:hypothetical protein
MSDGQAIKMHMTEMSWIVSTIPAFYIMRMAIKSENLSFRIAAEEAVSLSEAARTRDVPRATVIRWAIREFLDRNAPTTQHFMRG